MASTAPGQKVHPFGTSLEYSSDGGGTYTQQFDCNLVSLPDEERDTAQVTVIDSPNMVKERISSWIDAGKIPLEVYYSGTGAVYSTLRGFFADGLIRYWRIKLPLLSGQATKATFIRQAIVTKCKLSEAKAEENNPYLISLELTIATDTGNTFAAAA